MPAHSSLDTTNFGGGDMDTFSNAVIEQLSFISSTDESHLASLRRKGRLEALIERLSRFCTRNTGLFLICLSQLSSSCMSASVQALNRRERPFPPTEILVFRQSITWSITYSYMRWRGVNHPLFGPPEVRWLLVLRGTAGFCGVFGTYYALQYLSLPDATVLTFLSPFFTSFGGTFFLGETFSPRNFFAGVVSLAGVVLIARPKALFGSALEEDTTSTIGNATSQERLLAVGIAMLGVLGASGAYISLRAIGKRAHTLHCMNYFAFFSGTISLCLVIIRKTDIETPADWQAIALLFAVSLFGFGAQVLHKIMLVWGLHRETASRGSLAIYTQIVFAYILERVLFHETPSFLSLVGTIIILGSGLFVALTKKKDISENPHESGRLLNEPHELTDEEIGMINRETSMGQLREHSSEMNTPKPFRSQTMSGGSPV